MSVALLAALGAGRAPSVWRRDIARTLARVRILVDIGRWVQDLSSTMPVLREGPLFGPLLEVVVMEDPLPAAAPPPHPTLRSNAAGAREPRRRARTGRQRTEPATPLVTRPDTVSHPQASGRRPTEPAPSGRKATTLPRLAPATLLSSLAAWPAGPFTSHASNRTLSPILVSSRVSVRALASSDRAGAIAYREDLIRRASAVIDADQPPTDPAAGGHLATQWAAPLSGERAPAALLLSTEEVGRFSAAVDGALLTAPGRASQVGVSHPGRRSGTAAGSVNPSPETASSGSALADRFPLLKGLVPMPVLATPGAGTVPSEAIPYAAPDGEDLALPDAFGGWAALSPSLAPLPAPLPTPLPAPSAHSTRETMHLADLESAAARQTLAEEMRRILVEEARRHGIDV